jgi:hypothetical protein
MRVQLLSDCYLILLQTAVLTTDSLRYILKSSYLTLFLKNITHHYTRTAVAAGADVDACDAHGDSVLKFALAAPPQGAMLRALRAAAQFNSVNFATTSDSPPSMVAATAVGQPGPHWVTRPRRSSIGSSTNSSSKGRKLSGVLKSSSSSDTDTSATTAATATSSDSEQQQQQQQRRVRFSVDLSISGEVGAGGLGALQQRGAWRAR